MIECKYLSCLALLCQIIISIQGTAKSSDEASSKLRKVYIPQGFQLPEQFTNDRLPRMLDNAERCYNLIGCFERIPVTTLPQDPASFRTQFRIYSRGRVDGTLVPFEKIENCQANSDECDVYPYDLSSILNSSFSVRKRTIILIGGYFSKDPSSWELRMKDLWLKLDDVNVIIVSWTGGNNGIYQTAAVNTRPVGRQLTVLLYYIAKLNGLDLSDDSFTEKIYIVGHSLGAHIAGFTGTDLGGRLGRITGLEPAGPTFDSLDVRFRLDKGDAQLVDILHTNAGASIFLESQYGSGLKSGHIDLYANDGLHQPGCSSDRLGCSHKKANNYYEAFLNHELAMRDYLPKSKRMYRLFAYSSPSYDEFHNGSGLLRYCPITTLDDDNLSSIDLPKCSIPIDYISWFDVYKKELEEKHGIDFHPDAINEKRYYFYTDQDGQEQSDHYLLKIRANKRETTIKKQGCDLSLDFVMKNGLDNKYKIKKYQLVDDEGEYEIVVPFLSPNIITKYEIAKLDTNEYYMNNNDDNHSDDIIRKSLARILPMSITITGIDINGGDKKKSGGVINYFKRMFNMGKNSDKENEKPESACNLDIDSLTVKPLRRFHRDLLAIYSANAKDKPTPDLIVFNDKSDKSPKKELMKFATKPVDPINPKLYLDTVIFGPYDESIIDPPDDDDDDDNNNNNNNDETSDPIQVEANNLSSNMAYSGGTSNISAKTWLTLTISLTIVMVIAALIAMLSTKRFDETDKRPFLTEIQLE